jgi:hypothetical protein
MIYYGSWLERVYEDQQGRRHMYSRWQALAKGPHKQKAKVIPG